MENYEDFFQGASGLNLYYQAWYPPNKIRTVLIMVHGLGGHSNLYKNIVDYLVPKDYAIYACDLPGHGRSPGLRGHINTWNDYRESLAAFVELVTQKHLGIPAFLFGHSNGGLISIDYILRYSRLAQTSTKISSQTLPLLGLMTLAPALGKVKISPAKLLLGKVLSKIAPTFRLSTGIDLSKATRDKDVVEKLRQDKLRSTLGSARLSTEFMSTTKWVNANVKDFPLPLLVLHGDADEVIPVEVSRELLQQVELADKKLIEYPGGYHELQSDLCYPEVLADMEIWLEHHLP